MMAKKSSKNSSLWSEQELPENQSSQSESPEEMAKRENDKSARNKRSH